MIMTFRSPYRFILVPTSTNHAKNENSITIFPNPTTDFVTVEAEGLEAGTYTIRLTDLHGRLIQTQTRTFTAGDETRVTLDLNKEAAGVYILDLVSEDNPLEAKALRVVKE